MHRTKTTNHVRGTTPEIVAAAQRMRRNLTPAEQALWQALRGRRLNGLKFRCQHPVGPFVLDFYCPARRLAVEVDGDVHDEQMAHDEARSDELRDYGYRVIRCRNDEVLDNLDAVLDRIRQAALAE